MHHAFKMHHAFSLIFHIQHYDLYFLPGNNFAIWRGESTCTYTLYTSFQQCWIFSKSATWRILMDLRWLGLKDSLCERWIWHDVISSEKHTLHVHVHDVGTCTLYVWTHLDLFANITVCKPICIMHAGQANGPQKCKTYMIHTCIFTSFCLKC